MKKLLITGASGFLGWHLCQLAARSWQVYGVGHRHPVPQPQVRSLQFDLTDGAALQTQFDTIRPDAVIHAAALSSPNACQDHPDRSYEINVIVSCHLAELCATVAIPYVFTSSEQVFDGLNAPYREADPVCPVNLYGTHKVAAEVGILERYSDAAICRMPLMYGVAPQAPSFIQPFIETIKAGRVLNLFTDEFRNPVSGMAAAEGLLLALDKQVSGYLHLGGKERLSRYEMGQLLVEILQRKGQITSAHLNACRQADVTMAAPRPPDASLESGLAFSMGYAPRRMGEELEEML